MVLQKGDPAPNFEYFTKNGNKQEFHNVEGKKIIFFFPRAFTPACTAEACSLQDNYADLKQEGVSEVFGISLDDRDKQEDFSKKFNLEYILVDDRNGGISKAYGVFQKKLFIFKYSDRYTFLVGEDNKILEVFENGLRGGKSKYGMEQHGKEILEFLQ